MKYLPFLILVLILVGCSQKPIEYIFIQGAEKFIWQKSDEATIKWYHATVIQKKGDMWLIELDGREIWLDTKDPDINWRIDK